MNRWLLCVVAMMSGMAFAQGRVDRVESNPPTKGTGTTEECLAAKNRYFARVRVQISCTPDAHIYHSMSTTTAARASILKVGQFNVFRLGEDSSKFKNFPLMAKIINQWDVVGAVELTPTKDSIREHNREMDGLNTEAARASYWAPGHIRLLLALRNLDPSWSLIMSSEARGEGSSGELAGFYYRASRLNPVPTRYCVQVTGDRAASGCTARFAENDDPLVSRPPFIASFRVGNSAFTFVTSHIRFSASNEERQKLLRVFPGNCGTRCPAREEIQPRLAEARLTAKVISDLEILEGRAVVWGGDFNFGAKDLSRGSSLAFTFGLLPGASLLNDAETSLATDDGLASSYDHFVLGRSGQAFCNSQSVRVFDFRDTRFLPELSYYRTQADVIFQDYKSTWTKQITIKRRKEVPLWTPKALREAEQDFDESIRNPKAPNQFFRAVLSDHLPISMECQIN